MHGYIGYIRVSTVKQGTQGVSLQEQRDAIVRYSEKNRFQITFWLEEMETAAKQGRPVFNQALKLLRTRKARGIILHKLDRGARNLRDWAAIGELSDQGSEVHFVNECIDLQSRGGRLSADIQAVVAADYIRNLREETRKGFYGRLKQGLYPLGAPIGYLDQGKAKAKTIDPTKGPLVRIAFELYAAARYNLATLSEELHRRGLRSRNGGRISKTGWSTILNNPFYIGIMHIAKTGESFDGIHDPLISKSLFDRTQAVLTGKTNTKNLRHDFQFRRMLSCTSCHYSLIGERQKGHVYYRCHSLQCRGTAIREEAVETKLTLLLASFKFSNGELAILKAKIQAMKASWANTQETEHRTLQLRISQIRDRLNRLTDALIDGTIDKVLFEDRKRSLLLDLRAAEEALANQDSMSGPERIEKILELADNAQLSHEMAFPDEKRELVKIVTSNRLVSGKNVDFKPSIPFREIANRHQTACCGPKRDTPRTMEHILQHLTALNNAGELPDLEFPISSHQPSRADGDDSTPLDDCHKSQIPSLPRRVPTKYRLP